MEASREILALNAFDRQDGRELGPALSRSVERRLRRFGDRSVLFYQRPTRWPAPKGSG